MSAELFSNLHRGPELLLLPNAWDAVSARLIESLGAKAIATTSAGLAWSCGYPDGNALPEEELIAATHAIARVIRVPLTVDIEGGYSDDPGVAARLVVRLSALGVVGINIEDGTGSPDLLCEKIAAIRNQLEHSGGDMFVNARTDTFLNGAVGKAAMDETLRRASRYRAAGCDGLFVPGLATADAIAAIVAAVDPMPLNVMAVPTLPSMELLQRSGVRRLSAGSAIAQSAIARTRRLASAFLAGSMSEMFEDAAGYGEVNGLFAVQGAS
jgi:2-methylisocitrate lyase-like PEP mutase family enzyme